MLFISIGLIIIGVGIGGSVGGYGWYRLLNGDDRVINFFYWIGGSFCGVLISTFGCMLLK